MNFKKIDFNKLKEIKSFSFLIIPDNSGIKANSHELSPKKVALIILLYSIIVFFFSYLLLAFTPVGDLLNVSGKTLTSEDMSEVQILNERMVFLAKELEKMKSTNEKLRYAIFLGDSTLIDSLKYTDSLGVKSDDTKKPTSKIKGDILKVIKQLFFNYGEDQGKDYLFSRPVNGFISREFDPDKGHNGIDYVVRTGTPVFAASSGYVIFADYTVKDGYMILISSTNEYVTVYKHCSALLKKTRDLVTQGEIIALSGNTGEITTGPHLHFEIWKNGYPINPKKVLINY